jgi:hypothetical protein
MKRKILIGFITGLFFVVGGTLTVKHLEDRKDAGPPGTPEGYEEPEGRVEKLKIEGSVSKYYDENIDLVAFGPGSGWLKIKTRDGISPTLSFNRVSTKDIQKFNKFSESIGLPVRVEFSNNILRLTADEEGHDPIYVADITEEKIGANSIMNKGFFEKEIPTRLVIRRDRNGKVKLVAADSPKGTPGAAPDEEDIRIAEKKEDKVSR